MAWGKSIKLNTAQARPIVKATFPDYRGRKFRLQFADSYTFSGLNWSGGSRNEYRLVKANGQVGNLVNANAAPWDNPVEGQTMELTPDVMIVRHSIFCGEDVGITIYAHPDTGPRLLKA